VLEVLAVNLQTNPCVNGYQTTLEQSAYDPAIPYDIPPGPMERIVAQQRAQGPHARAPAGMDELNSRVIGLAAPVDPCLRRNTSSRRPTYEVGCVVPRDRTPLRVFASPDGIVQKLRPAWAAPGSADASMGGSSTHGSSSHGLLGVWSAAAVAAVVPPPTPAPHMAAAAGPPRVGAARVAAAPRAPCLPHRRRRGHPTHRTRPTTSCR
jgi:hypothetical protein